MPDPRHVRTERLQLDAVVADDLDELYAISSDARLWQHYPAGRHTDQDTTARQLAGFLQSWADDGLGYWLARDAATAAVVGVGGCMLRRGVMWNVYYRFRPEAQRRGYATELAGAALAAARAARPELPVTAFLMEHNVASRRTAERAGLQLVWRGAVPALNPQDPGAVQLVLSDRPLDDTLLDIARRAA